MKILQICTLCQQQGPQQGQRAWGLDQGYACTTGTTQHNTAGETTGLVEYEPKNGLGGWMWGGLISMCRPTQHAANTAYACNQLGPSPC
jgi:hypothetical protein